MSVLVNPFSFAGANGNDAFTKLLLHMDGANGSTTFTDSSSTVATVAASHVTIDTSTSKFGGASGAFVNGNGSVLTVTNVAALRPGTADFTIDFWFNWSGATDSPIWWGIGDTDMVIEANHAALGLAWEGKNIINPGNGFFATDSLWHHYAIVRHGTAVAAYRDGVSKFTGSDNPVSDISDTSDILIGAQSVDGLFALTGRLDEYRLSVGIARWTSNFTPPTQAYS